MATRLQEIVQTDPNARKVSLQGEGITDLQPLLNLLAMLENLTSLDLSNNRIMSLPTDLSALSRVTELQLHNNPLRQAADVMPGLESMPALASLTIDLEGQEEEEKLVALPGLRELNKFSLDATASAAPASGASGAAGGGAGAGAGAGAGTSGGGGGGGGGGAGIREIAMTEADLELVATLFGAINALDGARTPQDDSALTAEFESHIHRVMLDLQTKLQDLEDPFLRQGDILMAKHDLYDICFEQAMKHASKVAGDDFGAVLRRLRDVHKGLFNEFPGVLRDMRPHYTKTIQDMKVEVTQARLETGKLLEAAELLEAEAEAKSDEKERLGVSFERERQRLLNVNRQLQQEAASLASRLRQYESGVVPPAHTSNGRSMDGGMPAPPMARNGLAPPPAPASGAGAGAGAGASAGGVTAPAAPGVVPGSRTAVVVGGSEVTIRNLSLKQLREVIEAIYASKVKFDQKCAEAHLPRETMEQHMYTYLNQRYGLKSLIIEHASSIHRAVNKYKEQDNDVAVFGKILHNEIDEEFRYVQKQLKETVADLLRVYLKGKFPQKTDDTINELLKQRLQGVVYQEEWMDIIKYMYNHSDSLALIVMVNDLIRQQPAAPAAPSSGISKRKGRRAPRTTASGHDDNKGAVPFNAFLKVLLDFQLKGHQRFLANFHAMFKEVDSDHNGVVNEAELRHLVKTIDPAKTEAELTELLNMVDPHNNQLITFSECVSVLSQELVDMMAASTQQA